MIALALAVADVEHHQIAEDYAASAGHLASRFSAALVAEVDPDARKMLQRAHATDPATMLTLLDHLERRYGGAASYLRTHGVDDARLELLLCSVGDFRVALCCRPPSMSVVGGAWG